MTSLDMTELKPGYIVKLKDGRFYVIVSTEHCHIEMDEEGEKWIFEGVKSRLQILTDEQVKQIMSKSGGKLVYSYRHLTMEEE